MKKGNTENKILVVLLKQFSINWIITSLANELKITRVGVWKILKKLKKENLIILSPIGQGKTNTISIRLNWENIILGKKLALILTEEASEHQRWLNNFEELKRITEFTIIYGSILHSPKEAKDIDILEVVSNKNNFLEIEKIMQKSQKSQVKKIHSESFTKTEFRDELKKPNKIFIDAVKKGVVLFGQENFIKLLKDMQK